MFHRAAETKYAAATSNTEAAVYDQSPSPRGASSSSALSRDDLAQQHSSTSSRRAVRLEPDGRAVAVRFIAPHDEDRPITWAGRTLPAGDISYMHVACSDGEAPAQGARDQFKEYDLFTPRLPDVTNDWVVVAPGSAASPPASGAGQEPAERVVELCRRFGAIARQLTRRYGNGRTTLVVNDEYDAQDLLHALLLIDFSDVREESWNPKYLGGSSRIDLLLPEQKLVVEVKKTRATLTDRGVGDELAEDVTRYSDPPLTEERQR